MKYEIINYNSEKDENTRKEYIGFFIENSDEFFRCLTIDIIDERNLAYALAQMSKKITLTNRINEFLSKNNKIIRKLLFNDDSKTRKNFYITLGNIKSSVLVNNIDEIFAFETTLFCIPSLILSLGDVDVKIDKINDFLSIVLSGKIEDKHKSEIENAFNKIKDKKIESKLAVFSNFIEKQDILLTTIEEQEIFLIEDIKKLHLEYDVMKGGVLVKNIDNFASIMKCRTFFEALIYNDKLINVKSESIIYNCSNFLKNLNLLKSYNSSEVRYRIETKVNIRDKQDLIKSLIKDIGKVCGINYINSPSNYDFEIRIEEVDANYSAYIKICGIDNRFDYRQEDLPASINPVTASIIAKIANRYCKKGEVICDGFCGSGTLLIERNKISQYERTIASDIFNKAISKCKINANLANMNFDYYTTDFQYANYNCKVDEFISNLPFGNRVGSHSDNVELYNRMFKKIDDIMKLGGHIFILSTEKALIRICLNDTNFKLVKTYKISSGGLYPDLFVLRKIQ